MQRGTRFVLRRSVAMQGGTRFVYFGCSCGWSNMASVRVSGTCANPAHFCICWKQIKNKWCTGSGHNRHQSSKHVGKHNSLHDPLGCSLAPTWQSPFFGQHTSGAPMELQNTFKTTWNSYVEAFFGTHFWGPIWTSGKKSHAAWRSFCITAERSHATWRSFCIQNMRCIQNSTFDLKNTPYRRESRVHWDTSTKQSYRNGGFIESSFLKPLLG